MKQYLHIVTLGVRDLEVARKFYTETLGWQAASPSSDAIVFIQAGGVVLALFPHDLLAEDAAVDAQSSGFSGFTLAHNAHSEAQVDEIINDLRSKGVKILKEPQKVSWGGYSSYFADPDGYAWEVAYNPFFSFDEHGNLKLE